MNQNDSTKTGKLIHEKGFTLLEVIIAISILTFGILAVASMQISSIRGNAIAGTVSEATNLAGDRIEKLIALPYTNADLSAGPHTDTSNHSYTITWTVTDNVVFNNTKSIDISVTWTDRGVAKSLTLQYIKAA